MAQRSRRWSGGLVGVAVLLAVLLVTSGCVVGTGGGTSDRPARPLPSGVPGVQEDGTMTAEEFEGDLQGAVEVAETYWGEQLRSRGRQFQPVGRVVAYQRDDEVSCGDQEVPRNNAVYCPAGDFIAYDVTWAVAAFGQIGDAFLFYLLGHEYAHGIQVRLGIEYRFTIQQELQADCMAGAYIGDSVQAKALSLQRGDLDELRDGLLAVGDDPGQPWFAEGSHGSAEQRTQSFFAGYERSLAACGLR